MDPQVWRGHRAGAGLAWLGTQGAAKRLDAAAGGNGCQAAPPSGSTCRPMHSNIRLAEARPETFPLVTLGARHVATARRWLATTYAACACCKTVLAVREQGAAGEREICVCTPFSTCQGTWIAHTPAPSCSAAAAGPLLSKAAPAALAASAAPFQPLPPARRPGAHLSATSHPAAIGDLIMLYPRVSALAGTTARVAELFEQVGLRAGG